MGDENIKQQTESLFYSVDELIQHLENDAKEDELKYYIETCNDEKIKSVAQKSISKILEQKIENLTKENEIGRAHV